MVDHASLIDQLKSEMTQLKSGLNLQGTSLQINFIHKYLKSFHFLIERYLYWRDVCIREMSVLDVCIREVSVLERCLY